MVTSGLAHCCALAAGAAALIALTAGCSGQLNSTGSVTTATTTAAAPTASGDTDTGSVSSTGSASEGAQPTASGHATTSECKATNLKAALGPGSGAGAGSEYPSLEFTNISSTTCVLAGFPGVSFVTGDNGQQVGAAAVRDGSAGAPVTLAPGQTASSALKEANAADYPPSDCNPVPVAGFRVYAPDDTAAMFVPSNDTACSATNMPGGPQLFVRTLVAGAGNS